MTRLALLGLVVLVVLVVLAALRGGGVLGLARSVRVRWWAFLARRRPLDALLDLLSSTGIAVFVGPNGSGKSLLAVACELQALDGVGWTCFEAVHAHHDGYRAHLATGCGICPPAGLVARRFRSGVALDDPELQAHFCLWGWGELNKGATGERLVYSTVPLLGDDGEDHPRSRPLVDYRQLLKIEHADVLFDEVAGVSDASDSGAIPVQVVQWLHTLRKVDVRLRVTTPAYGRCSKPIRQVAQVAVDCRSYAPEAAASGRLWRPRQGFVARAYDAFAFEDYTASTGERLQPLATSVLWRPGHEAERRYETLGQVLSLGHVTEAGMCSACGGARSKPKCACPVLSEDDADLPLQVVESVSPAGTRTRKAVPVASSELVA